MGTTALYGIGLLASAAAASDGISLSLGGFYRTAYMANVDDRGGNDLGTDRNTDGFFSDGEVHFKGEVTLDSGLTAGVFIALEAENEDNQFDESWAYFSGGFGQVRIGNDDSAMQGACITPPGVTANFGAFSPQQWAANDSAAISSSGTLVAPTSNSICWGADDVATKLVYYSPTFNGFSFALSYAPDGAARGGGNSGGHNGMGARATGSYQHDVAAYVTYSYANDDWSFTWGGGVDVVGRVDQDGATGGHIEAAENYQTGLVLAFGNLSVGGAFQYYNDFSAVPGTDADGWVAGGGISYDVDALTVGLQYSHLDFDNEIAAADDISFTRDRIVLTGNYAMAPGIDLDASIGYTWVRTDADGAATGADNYDVFEIGLGSAFTF